MRRAVGAVLAGAAVTVAGCSAPTNPEITFYADGDAVQAKPLVYCDALLNQCEEGEEPVQLNARPGMPVQISLPGEVSATPWALTVQFRTPDGEQPVQERQQVFTDGEQHAYTVTPPSAEHQVLVVEIQQLGAAYAGDEQGEPLVDEQGQPQIMIRGTWSLQVQPA